MGGGGVDVMDQSLPGAVEMATFDSKYSKASMRHKCFLQDKYETIANF